MLEKPQKSFFYRRPLCLSLCLGLLFFALSIVLPAFIKPILAIILFSLAVFFFILSFVLLKRHAIPQYPRRLRRLALTCLLCFLPLLLTYFQIDTVLTKTPKESAVYTCQIEGIISKSENATVCRVDIKDVTFYENGEKVKKKTDFSAQLSLFTKGEYCIGDVFVCRTRLTPATEADYGSFLLSEGCFFTSDYVSILSYESLSTKNASNTSKNEVEHELKQLYKDNVNHETASFLSAFLLGDTDDFSPRTALDFRRLGLSHLSAVSGLNVTLLICFLELLLRRLFVPRNIRLLISCFALVFYLWLVGFAASAVRAGIMQLVVIFAFFRRGQYDSVTALAFVAYVMCLFVPLCIFSASYWLSVTATAGILIVVERRMQEDHTPLRTKLQETLSKNHYSLAYRLFCSFLILCRTLLSYVYLSLLISFGAVIATLPIIIFLYGALSPLSPIATLLCTPFVQILLYGAALFPLLFFLSPFTWLLELTASFMCSLIHWLSKPTFAYLYAKDPLFLGAVILLVILILIVVLLPKRIPLVTGALVLGFFVFSTVFFTLQYNRNHDETLLMYQPKTSSASLAVRIENDLTLIDISNGQSAFTGATHAITDQAETFIIDNYVVTNYDTKLLYRLRSVSSNYQIKRIYIPITKQVEDESIAKKIEEHCRDMDISCHFYHQDEPLSINDDVTFSKSQYLNAQNDDSSIAMLDVYDTKITCLSANRLTPLPDRAIVHLLLSSDVVVVQNMKTELLSPSWSGFFPPRTDIVFDGISTQKDMKETNDTLSHEGKIYYPKKELFHMQIHE